MRKNVFTPGVIAEAFDIISVNGYLARPPLIFYRSARELHLSSLATVDNARLIDSKGEFHGQGDLVLQNTTLVTGLNTGRTFTVNAGNWIESTLLPQTDTVGLLKADISGSTEASITSSTTTTGIEAAEIVLFQGPAAPVALAGGRHRTTNYSYVYLAWQDASGIDYRIGSEYGQPLFLDYTLDTWAHSKRVDVHKDIASKETRYRNSKGWQVTFRIRIDKQRKLITIELDDGHLLQHSPPVLPANGNIHFAAASGWAGLCYFPLAHTPFTVTHDDFAFGSYSIDPTTAFGYANQLSKAPPGQTITPTIGQSAPNSLNYSMVVTPPDAGSIPILSDITVVIPAFRNPSSPSPYHAFLRTTHVKEISVFDPVARVGKTTMRLAAANYDGLYDTLKTNLAVAVSASNGPSGYVQRIYGVTAGPGALGLSVSEGGLNDIMSLELSDLSHLCDVAIGQRIVIDGYCWTGAVHLAATLGNVSPASMVTIPNYYPSYATASDPYGPAETDCPYYSLATGLGNHPLYEFGPEITAWQVLQTIAQDLSIIDAATGITVPYMCWFDPTGQLRFEPYNPFSSPPSWTFSATLPGANQILRFLSIEFSLDGVRTSVDIEGIDIETGELLYFHQDQSPAVIGAKGYRDILFLRQGRYGTPAFVIYVGNSAIAQTAIPVTAITFEAIFQPGLCGGSIINVNAGRKTGGNVVCFIERMESEYGMADEAGHSATRLDTAVYRARPLSNLI